MWSPFRAQQGRTEEVLEIVGPGCQHWLCTWSASCVASTSEAGITAHLPGHCREDLAPSCRQGCTQQVPVPGTASSLVLVGPCGPPHL